MVPIILNFLVALILALIAILGAIGMAAGKARQNIRRIRVD